MPTFRIPQFTRLFLLLVALFMTQAGALLSQPIKSFSTEPVQFLKDIETYISAADKQQAKLLIDQLEPAWKTKFSPAVQQTIMATSSAMLKKRMNAIPNFRDYFQCIIAYSESGKNVDYFNNWHTQLNTLITKITAGKFDQYLITSENFIRYNALYKSDAVAWYIGTNDVQFGYDSLPNIRIPLTNIRGVTRNDSTTIFNTSGIFYPTEYRFNGVGGKLLWERANLKENEANAQLKKYMLPVKTTKFKADSATFLFPKYFKDPLLGQVDEKLTDNPGGRDATFPRFSSYNTEFSIPGIFKNIDYFGGLTVQGAQLLGSGNQENPARFTFNRDG
ncbi:MAG: hypothetical protein RLZZ543_1141, partial [Bacteroidota bacterium]